jgi:hypothetical protein
MIAQDLTSWEEMKLLLFLDKNGDVFTWKTSDLTRVRKTIIETQKVEALQDVR